MKPPPGQWASARGDESAGDESVGESKTRILTAAVPAHKNSVTLHFLPKTGVKGKLALTRNGLLVLIQSLGRIHASMCAGREIPELEGQTIDAVFDPRWYVSPGLMGEATAMCFHHPAFGPVSFLVPIEQIRAMTRLLKTQVEAADRAKAAPGN